MRNGFFLGLGISLLLAGCAPKDLEVPAYKLKWTTDSVIPLVSQATLQYHVTAPKACYYLADPVITEIGDSIFVQPVLKAEDAGPCQGTEVGRIGQYTFKPKNPGVYTFLFPADPELGLFFPYLTKVLVVN